MGTDTELQVVNKGSQLARPDTFAPRTLDEALKFADLLLDSGMVPKSYVGKNAAAIVIALQFGMELGLQPLQSLQNIANINGQPGIWGDAALALVLNSPVCDYVNEQDLEDIKKAGKATCKAKRKNSRTEVVRTFSFDDAKTAGIFNNAVWKTYPARMCQMRARSFCLRDTFPDVLKGLELAEVIEDYSGQTINAQPATATTTPTSDPKKEEETIGTIGGNEFYKIYASNGWTSEQSLEFLDKELGIVRPRQSKDIPVSEWKNKDGSGGGRAWVWANSPSPIKIRVTEKFDILGLNADERRDFFTANMGEKKAEMYANVDKALSAEIDKRNAQEQ